jgi:hypothetical protein
MNNTLFIYLLTRLSSIQGLFVGLAIFTGLCAIGYFVFTMVQLDVYYGEEPDGKKIATGQKGMKRWGITSIIFILFAVMTPTTKEAMLIVAGGKTLDYVQKDTSFQKIPYKATELVLKKMEEYIDETTSDSTKTK